MSVRFLMAVCAASFVMQAAMGSDDFIVSGSMVRGEPRTEYSAFMDIDTRGWSESFAAKQDLDAMSWTEAFGPWMNINTRPPKGLVLTVR